MFQSATFKLTCWYLGIIVAISLLFSIVIYSIASREIITRIDTLQNRALEHGNPFLFGRDDQIHEAEASLVAGLFVANMLIWTGGGVCSYYLARRTLLPIQEAHEAQSRFVSDASHELRTPLASMKTELEVALRDPSLTKKDARELLESNLEEVNKLTQLSSTLLQLSKLNESAIAREKVTLQFAVQAAVRRFGGSAKRVQTEKSLLPIDALSNRLQTEELITILVDNALKYSPADSKVKITYTKNKQMVGFSVSNEGEGIPPKVLPHIFDRFYQAEKSRQHTHQKGFGLGLSLAKRIVEIHQGELSVSSAPGATTTFTVLFPRYIPKSILSKNRAGSA